MGNLPRLVRTVAHLKLRQITYQLLRRLAPQTKILPITGTVLLRQGVTMASPLQRDRQQTAQNAFTFLNQTRHFDPACFDWQPADMDKLWRYNLHYFDYLHEEGHDWENKIFLLDNWMNNNPQGTPDAWEPFPVSLRMVNWIKLFLSPAAVEKLEQRWLQSLYQQALWLEKNIEYHLLANHYFKNGKALVFAGRFFTGCDAERWLKKGLQIVSEQLDEQILPDGGHFERSPMYHAMILEDCLDLLNLGLGSGGEVLTEKLTDTCRRMLYFLAGMTHPDGDIALFNDAAIGIEPNYTELAEYSERLTGRIPEVPAGANCSFPDSGYYVLTPQDGDRLIVDCGAVGPDYQPGHAHADTLSFELSLQGQRVIVDSGCCQYLDSDIRRYNRGNEGHNSVTVDGENQSEVWGAHRCARRARPLRCRLEKREDDTLIFTGAHDGYRRLKGKPIHQRSIAWSGDTCLIEDRLEGEGSHDLELRLHIHPSLSTEVVEGTVVIQSGVLLLATISRLDSGRIETTEGWYCPQFGQQQKCAVLITRYPKARLPFDCGWAIKTG